MQTTDEFAVFIHYELPVITRTTSLVYKLLTKRGCVYFTGTLEGCEKVADSVVEIVAFKETEQA